MGEAAERKITDKLVLDIPIDGEDSWVSFDLVLRNTGDATLRKPALQVLSSSASAFVEQRHVPHAREERNFLQLSDGLLDIHPAGRVGPYVFELQIFVPEGFHELELTLSTFGENLERSSRSLQCKIVRKS